MLEPDDEELFDLELFFDFECEPPHLHFGGDFFSGVQDFFEGGDGFLQTFFGGEHEIGFFFGGLGLGLGVYFFGEQELIGLLEFLPNEPPWITLDDPLSSSRGAGTAKMESALASSPLSFV